MTMNLHDGTDHNGLFDLQGQAIAAIDALNTFAGTTLPAEFDDIVAAFEAATGYPLDFQSAIQGLPNALVSWQSAGETLVGAIQTYIQQILAGMVNNEAGYQAILQSDTLANQINYLIDEMTTQGAYIAPNTVGGTLTPGSNAGDVAMTWSLLNGKGYDEQNAYAETLTMTVNANPSATRPSIGVLGEPSVNKLAATWPQGSGTTVTLTATTPTSSLVPNGTFTAQANANVPDSWVIGVGVPGTTITITAPEQQTVAIAGTPTGGVYCLKWTDADSITWTSPTLAYNASASSVQSALRTIPGLSLVTVTATGTTPNYTHTIVFTGVGGNPAQLTSVNLLSGGSPTITHATTVSGVAGDYRGSSLTLVGDSSTLHSLCVPLSGLKTETVYSCHLRIRRTGTATGASMTVGIIQSIGGAILDDTAGNANSLVIDLAAVSASAHESEWFTFRLPATAVSPVYLSLACTVAIPTGASIFIADVAVAAATQLYAGGPFAVAFSGINAPLAGDSWTLAITNDHAGEWMDAYARYFNTMATDVFLPSTGSTLIDDALIA